jgi:hypothetical protein
MWAQFRSLVFRFGDVWSKVSDVNSFSLELRELRFLGDTISVHLHGNLLLVF